MIKVRKAATTNMWRSSYIWGYVLSYLMGSTRSTDCPYHKFTPYNCQFVSQTNKRLNLSCTVFNNFGCEHFKEQVPPKGLQPNTVRLVSMNIYHIEYDDVNYRNEKYPALNYTFSLPNCDMFKSCQAVRVNIWNNATNSYYGNQGICRLFHFNSSKKNIQQIYINHKCFTAISADKYFLKFTTLPFTTEITYTITIKNPRDILAVAPVHHQLAISIILGFPVNSTCMNQYHLISLKTGTENNKTSTKNSYLFENLQPGSFRVRVESSCFQNVKDIQSEIILLKSIPEPESLLNTNFIWILLSLIPFIILIICLYLYFKRKQKCIDQSHKCVIDMMYDSNVKADVIVASQLIKLMEEEFGWFVNNIPVDSFMTCSCELPSNDVVLYLASPDMYGKVKIPQHYKNIDVAKALLYYRPKHKKLIWVNCKQSFDIIKEIKKIYYFVYRTTKINSQAELFFETHYPSVNYIGKMKFWNKFVDLTENPFIEYNSNH